MVELPRIEDRRVDGVGVRIYWPRADAAGPPIVVYYHGGGFFMGNLDTHDNVARTIAHRVGAVVVSVDYRLAPEHPYPAALEDAFTALRWTAAHARELGANPERIAVVSDSVSGNLAAMVALRARDSRRATAALPADVVPVHPHRPHPALRGRERRRARPAPPRRRAVAPSN